MRLATALRRTVVDRTVPRGTGGTDQRAQAAGADRVTISVSLTAAGGQLVVADNGSGFRMDRWPPPR